MKSRVLVAYVPVLHRGYWSLFQKYTNERLYLVGGEVIVDLEDFDYLVRKDRLRAIPTGSMISLLRHMNVFSSVEELTLETLRPLSVEDIVLVLPNEDISRAIVARYFSHTPVVFEDIFLRWHRDNTTEQHSVLHHRSVSVSQLDIELLGAAYQEAKKSWDWWRQVGCVVARDGAVILAAHNQHVPDEQSANINGDPRSLFRRGLHFDLSTAEHAEQAVISEAARRGTSLEGASMYLTDFPCPACARAIRRSGIKKLFFGRGYAVLDGDEILRGSGVELVFVEGMEKDSPSSE